MKKTVLKVDATHKHSRRQDLQKIVHIAVIHSRADQRIVKTILMVGPIAHHWDFPPIAINCEGQTLKSRWAQPPPYQ